VAEPKNNFAERAVGSTENRYGGKIDECRRVRIPSMTGRAKIKGRNIVPIRWKGKRDQSINGAPSDILEEGKRETKEVRKVQRGRISGLTPIYPLRTNGMARNGKARRAVGSVILYQIKNFIREGHLGVVYSGVRGTRAGLGRSAGSWAIKTRPGGLEHRDLSHQNQNS